MAKQRNILQEAIADTKALKEAAYQNAQSVLMEHLKDNVKQFVEQELNESLQAEGEEGEISEGEEKQLGEAEDMADTDVLDVEEMPDEDSDEDSEESEEVEEGLGLTEADLEEALQAALSEVDHGDLGEMEMVMNDTPSGTVKKSQGIADLDSKEEGWEAKTAPKAVAPALGTKEQYHQESKSYKGKIAKLVKENLMLKKANEKISEALQDTKLFNAKLFYATKLMQKEGLSNSMKASIVKKMDKVGSLSEAKNLYESLELALGLVKESVPAQRKTPSLTEALGSNRSAGTGKGVSDVDQQQYVSRNQVLAGMRKE